MREEDLGLIVMALWEIGARNWGKA